MRNLIVALLHLGAAISYAQPARPSVTPSATSQVTAPTAAAARSVSPAPQSSATPASSSTVPLTIDQIRSNLTLLQSADRFEFLRHQRTVTLEAIDEAAAEVKTLTASIAVLQNRKEALEAQKKVVTPKILSKERMESDLTRAKDDAAKIQQTLKPPAPTNKQPSAAEVAQLQSDLRNKESLIAEIEDAIRNAEDRVRQDEETKAENERALTEATGELSKLNDDRDKAARDQLSYQRLLGEIDHTVNQLFLASDATNSFKLRMSIILSVLIAVVIIGFFIVIWSDTEVKQKIFSNEAGIQFITMFAIVISVILFGIIGVLESKELSALLGGLSGYILGRSKSTT
jgi:hypothetical protein